MRRTIFAFISVTFVFVGVSILVMVVRNWGEVEEPFVYNCQLHYQNEYDNATTRLVESRQDLIKYSYSLNMDFLGWYADPEYTQKVTDKYCSEGVDIYAFKEFDEFSLNLIVNTLASVTVKTVIDETKLQIYLTDNNDIFVSFSRFGDFRNPNETLHNLKEVLILEEDENIVDVLVYKDYELNILTDSGRIIFIDLTQTADGDFLSFKSKIVENLLPQYNFKKLIEVRSVLLGITDDSQVVLLENEEGTFKHRNITSDIMLHTSDIPLAQLYVDADGYYVYATDTEQNIHLIDFTRYQIDGEFTVETYQEQHGITSEYLLSFLKDDEDIMILNNGVLYKLIGSFLFEVDFPEVITFDYEVINYYEKSYTGSYILTNENLYYFEELEVGTGYKTFNGVPYLNISEQLDLEENEKITEIISVDKAQTMMMVLLTSQGNVYTTPLFFTNEEVEYRDKEHGPDVDTVYHNLKAQLEIDETFNVHDLKEKSISVVLTSVDGFIYEVTLGDEETLYQKVDHYKPYYYQVATTTYNMTDNILTVATELFEDYQVHGVYHDSEFEDYYSFDRFSYLRRAAVFVNATTDENTTE